MHDNHGARPTERVRIPAVRIGPDGLGCMWHVSEIGGDTSSKFVGVSVVEYDGSAVHDVAGQAQLDGARRAEVSPPLLPLRLTWNDPHVCTFPGVLDDEFVPAAGLATDIGQERKVASRASAQRAAQYPPHCRVDQMIPDPESTGVAPAGHGGPRTEGCPRRPARISRPTSTTAWIMIIMLTTTAIVAEPPEAAFVPLATS